MTWAEVLPLVLHTFPSGKALVQAVAGWRYQRLSGSLGASALPSTAGSAANGAEGLRMRRREKNHWAMRLFMLRLIMLLIGEPTPVWVTAKITAIGYLS